MSTHGEVHVEIERGVARVVLDRAPVNAFDRHFYDLVRSTFHKLGEDRAVRVVTLTGKGKHFCGGNDVNDFVDMDYEGSVEYLAHVRLAFASVYECAVPVLGAINGAAVDTGIALASCCDVRIASERAKFALPEIDVGVLGGAKHVNRVATHGMTRQMMYTARRLDAAEAQRVGIADLVVPHEELTATDLAP